MRGHKRGCRCVACSPRTRAKGMRALEAWAKSGRRKKRTNPRPRAGGAGWRYEIEPFWTDGYGPEWHVAMVAGRKRTSVGTYTTLRRALVGLEEFAPLERGQEP